MNVRTFFVSAVHKLKIENRT